MPDASAETSNLVDDPAIEPEAPFENKSARKTAGPAAKKRATEKTPKKASGE
jgi:hypothetical protein